MPWSGGTFTLLYDWVSRRDAGSPTNKIGATEMLAQEQDIADGLELTIKANGDIAATGNLPMGGFLHTNVGAATARTNYTRVAELQDGAHVWIAGGGTADAITATYAPSLSALTNGQHVRVRATAANATTTPTFAPNGLTAKTIVKGANTALVAGDIAGQYHELQLQYNSTLDKWVLLNPAYPLATSAIDLNGLTTDATGGDVADLLAFVDASESNASNKVTVQKFYDVSYAALTAVTSVATGDKATILQSSVAKSITADNFLISGLQLLTTDTTGGATGDFIAFVDVSDSNNGNKVAVSDFVYNFLNNGTADASPEQAADHVLTRDNSASAYKKVLLQYVGAGLQTVWIPAGAMTARTTNGAAAGTTESATNKVMSKTLDFDASTIEYAQFTVAFPKSWDLGTVTAQFFWRSTNTGNCIWGLQGVAISDDDVTDAAFGTAQTVTDGVTATTDTMVSAATAAITIAGTPAAGDIVTFQVYRDASNGSDTLAVDALLVGVKLTYNCSVNNDT